MPSLPAFCDSCGAVFHSGFVVENSTNVTFSGNLSGPCPACGGMGHVPDGVFNFIGNTIEILSAPQRTVEELTRLVAILREAKEKQQPPEEVSQKIERELPGLRGLAAILPKSSAEWYGFLAVVLAAAQLVQSLTTSPAAPVTVNVSQVINQAAAQPSHPVASQRSQLAPRVGRNEKCPCGSGKKFKKCHGALR